MASIFKRGSTWYYSVNNYIDGVRKPIKKGGFRTKKEAQTAALEVEAKLKKGIKTQTKDKAFSAYFEEWVKIYKSNKHKNTYARYVNSVNRVKDYFKDMPIQKITRNDYQQFLNTYGKGKSKETVRKLNTHVRSCVRDAIEEGFIAIDFTRKVEIYGTADSIKESNKHMNYEETVKLYNYLFSILTPSNPTYYLILLGLVSGMRYGELVGLTWDAFDFKKNEIYIYQAWDYKEGKGKHGEGFDDLKNTQSERKIQIDPKVMLEFKKLFLTNSRKNKKPIIFSSYGKVGCITNENTNKVLTRILKNLKIERITMHGLRHTHASVLLYQGVNIQSVSKRLGHADIQTTMDHYAHVLKEMQERDESQAVQIFSNMRSN